MYYSSRLTTVGQAAIIERVSPFSGSDLENSKRFNNRLWRNISVRDLALLLAPRPTFTRELPWTIIRYIVVRMAPPEACEAYEISMARPALAARLVDVLFLGRLAHGVHALAIGVQEWTVAKHGTVSIQFYVVASVAGLGASFACAFPITNTASQTFNLINQIYYSK
ncbi:MAG: hypothetical protein EZS28_008504 [Streblomastix strix]|uniref:Uncharacterized protein n=1 Tax=Streblomastix strix TaxID=222440 RepID=A0A5J4WLX0_9EUKA|nr:MAG: hypothetical protein EZS28_008504 [Streblomastix strix]